MSYWPKLSHKFFFLNCYSNYPEQCNLLLWVCVILVNHYSQENGVVISCWVSHVPTTQLRMMHLSAKQDLWKGGAETWRLSEVHKPHPPMEQAPLVHSKQINKQDVQRYWITAPGYKSLFLEEHTQTFNLSIRILLMVRANIFMIQANIVCDTYFPKAGGREIFLSLLFPTPVCF